MSKPLSQYEKRKAKALAPNTPEVAPVDATVPVMTHTGYDVFLGPDNRTYQAITFSYNPTDGSVIVTDMKPVSRQVGLIFQNQKRALETLIK